MNKRWVLLLLLLLGEVGSLTGGGEPECEKLVEEAYQWAVGQGRPVDAAKAQELFLQAAEQGDPRALAWKGQRLYRGEPPFAKDQETGLRIFREIEKPLKKMADENRPYAAKILAGSWAVLDREKKGKEAFQLMKSLAETGDPDAIGYLGWFTEEGIGVQADPQAAFSFYKKAAEGGDILSFWHVGSAYQNGRGISRDLAQAFRWYSRGAEKNESSCQRMVAIAYFQGEGVTKDEAAAFGWFVKSAQLGNAESQDWLGWLYEAGRGTPADPKQAFVWFQKSAEAGYASGQKNLARCYEDGIGVSPDPEKAFRYYQKAAEGGQSWAMGKVAKFLETGKGTVKNPAEAFRWWQRQAEAGDFWAPEQVARCYAEGIGTPKNAEEAGKWYGQLRAKLEEETKKGSVWAWDNLGRYFFNGLGVDRDYAKALECYHKAAELKSGWAMEQIGWCHEKGLGVPVDEKEALKWYRKAAESGQTWSMGHVAVLYETGRGTEKNPAEAYRWYRKKAETGAGDRWADENVGRCHEKAIGTQKDDAEALRWYEKAARKGSLWAGEQAGRFYEEGLGTEKNPEMAYRFYLPSVQDKRPWAQYRIVALGSSHYYQGEYEFAERCFQAAWESGYRPAAHWLHQLHAGNPAWEKADPLKGIQIKRKSLREQSDEAEGSGVLAGQALSLGYVAEARQMTHELLASKQMQANHEQKARWHALAGYAALVEGPIDPAKVQGRTSPEKWLQRLESSPPVGMVSFNIKLVHPQSRLDFRHSGDFVAPIAPRRWASYLIQHIKWGVQIWREQDLRGFRTLALTATGGPGKGGAFLWADFPLKNRVQAEEQFQIAETLAPNFAARFGRAVVAWQNQDVVTIRNALETVQKELAEKALAAAEKRKQKDPNSSNRVPPKRGWSLQVEKFAQQGFLPWGNAKGEVSFGFGLSHAGGLFHGQLAGATWKLVVPFVLWLKPDWMLTVADMISQFGILSPMQMVALYTSLAEKAETRGKACARLAMIQVQLGEKEAAWEWAQQAATERPTDAEVLRMTAAIAGWAGKSKDAETWQRRCLEMEVRRELLSQASPESEYLRIFEALQEAERLEALKKTSEAELKFRKVLEDLKRLQDNHPDWETAVVQYRIRNLEKKLTTP